MFIKVQPTLLLAIVLSLITLGQFSIDIYLPSLPYMVTELQTSKSLVQLTLSVFMVSYGFSQLIYGPLSDSIGRRKSLFGGLFIFLIGSIGTSISHTIYWVLVFRFIQGLGIGSANVLCRAILSDLYKGRDLLKKTPILGMVWIISPVVAPVIGGYFENYFGWRMNFYFLTVLTIFIGMLVYLIVPETKDFAERHLFRPKVILKNYGILLSNRHFVGYVTTDMLLFGMFSSFYVAAPFIIHNRLGFPVIDLGWILLLISTGYMISSLVNIFLTHRITQKKIMSLGISIMGIITLIMVVLALLNIMSFTSVVIPLFFTFFGMGFIFTNCIAGCLSVYPALRGSASALWGLFALLGGTFASAIMSFLPIQTQTPLAVNFLFLTILAALVLFFLLFKNGIEEKVKS